MHTQSTEIGNVWAYARDNARPVKESDVKALIWEQSDFRAPSRKHLKVLKRARPEITPDVPRAPLPRTIMHLAINLGQDFRKVHRPNKCLVGSRPKPVIPATPKPAPIMGLLPNYYVPPVPPVPGHVQARIAASAAFTYGPFLPDVAAFLPTVFVSSNGDVQCV